MMGKFIRWVAALFILFASSLVAARVMGGLQPEPSFALLFTNPDGSPCPQPCLFGIRPGKTTYDEAVILLKNHPLTREYPHYPEAQYNPDGSVFREIELGGSGTRVFMFFYGNQPIISVKWRLAPARLVAAVTRPMHLPKFSEVVSLFGVPGNLITPQAGTNYFAYFGDTVLFTTTAIQAERIDPNDTVNLVSASIGDLEMAFSRLRLTWRGFTTIYHSLDMDQ